MSLVTESGDTLTSVYLFVGSAAQAGYLSAKLSTGSTYMLLKGPLNPNCFLSDIAASTTTVINFRLNIPSGTTEGLVNIVVYVGHDDGSSYPPKTWQDLPTSLWYDLDDLILWRDLEDWD